MNFYPKLRLPRSARPTVFPVPSMRLTSPSRKDSDNIDSMEYLIKRTLYEDGDDEGGITEKFCER